jgi:O-antigen ligase
VLRLAFILTRPKQDELKNTCKQPFDAVGILIGISLILGMVWTSADFTEALSFFWKMRAYYIIPILLIIFSLKSTRNYTLLGFGVMSLVTVMISVLSAMFDYPVFKGIRGDWFIFKTHTYHNFYIALTVAGLISIMLTQPMSMVKKAVLAGFGILAGFDILFLVTGRTGQIAFLSMIALVLLMWNWRRGLALLALMTLLLVFVLPRYSASFDDGVSSALADLKAYSEGNANTPVGMRLAWHEGSMKLIMESPLLGHGTGSFKNEYQKLSSTQTHAVSSENPHNDYLWLSVELGIPGGLLLLGILFAAIWQGRDLQAPWKWTLYALLLGMGISTLANSFFTDNTTGLAFVVLSCALLNGPKRKKFKHDQHYHCNL